MCDTQRDSKNYAEWLSFPEYLRELIWSKSQEIHSQNKDVRQPDDLIGNYYRNGPRLTGFINNTKKINLSYLSPFKYHQKNFYSLHHDENEAQLALINKSNLLSKDKKNGGKYLEFVTKWIEEFDIGISHEFKDINSQETKEKIGVQIFIKNENGKNVNLKDKGLGSGQIFFMILNIANLIFSKSHGLYRNYRDQKILFQIYF